MYFLAIFQFLGHFIWTDLYQENAYYSVNLKKKKMNSESNKVRYDFFYNP